MNKKEYALHMHNIVKGEVSMADSKIGWRITFIGILIGAFIALLIGFQDLMWWFLPFIIYFVIKLTFLINGLRPRLKYQRTKHKDIKEFNLYSFIDIASVELKTYIKKVNESLEGNLLQSDQLLEQVHTNAVIAYTKYNMFKWSFPAWKIIVDALKIAILINNFW